MRRFSLLEPASLEEACVALAERQPAKPIAGGTALVIMMKQGLVMPDVLVNLSKVPNADRIELVDGAVRIGALATMSDVASSALVQEHLPVLARACQVVANIRVRNVATLGGNLAHADYQADPPTALLALDSEVELRSVRGSRRMALDGFLYGSYATALEPDELVEAVRLPLAAPEASGPTWTYSRFTTRSSEDRPCAGVAAGLALREGCCTELRLAVGAATERPVRFPAVERAAIGRRVGTAFFDEVAQAAAEGIEPMEDLNGDDWYKRRVVQAIVRRALEACAGKEGSSS